MASAAAPRTRARAPPLRAAAAAAAPFAGDSPVCAEFARLAAQAGVDLSYVRLAERGGQSGRALVAARDAPKGCVLLAVPRSCCIVIDYRSDSGMSLPKGAWPRLVQGVNFREPLTWDLLQALALMDAIAGDGGDFWGAYASSLLPAPEEMTAPLCWDEPLQRELRHGAIEAAAAAQQERLAGFFPGLSRPAAPGAPSWLQWAFASVRSRAFRAGEEAWASVPFLDMANHASDPNADFAAALPAGAGGGPEGGAFYLVAVKDVKAGDEVTISYSGPEGYTNQRFMAQYGFVPRGGNMADRLELDVPEGATLPMEAVEDLLGSALLMDAARGVNPYLFAALKSLPLSVPNDDGGGAATTSARVLGERERALAAALLSQVDAEVAAAGSSLADDEAALAALERRLEEQQQRQQEGQQQQQQEEEEEEEARQQEGRESGGADPRLAAALRYRIERARLLQAARVVLAAAARGPAGAAAATAGAG